MGETKVGLDPKRTIQNRHEHPLVERSIKHLHLVRPLPVERQQPTTRIPDSANIVVFPLHRIKNPVPERSVHADKPPTKASVLQAIRWRDTVKKIASAKEKGQPPKVVALPTTGLYDYYSWEINNALKTLEGQVTRLREDEEQLNQGDGATVRILGIPQSQNTMTRLRERSDEYASRRH